MIYYYIILYTLGPILILIGLLMLWGNESCRRQQKRFDLESQGITEGEEYQKAINSFFD